MSTFWKDAKHSFNKLMGKTNKAIDAGRLQFDITQCRNKIGAAYRDIGRFVYHQSRDEDVNEFNTDNAFIASKLKEIDAYNYQINELKAKSKELFQEI